jgi:Tfp pilus assembly protein PilO
MKLSQFQQYAFVALILLLGVIFGYYTFLIKPLDADIVALQSDLQEKQKKLDAAKQTLAKYDEFKKRSAAVERELEWAQGRIPLQLDRSKFVEDINLIQARTQVVLTNFRFKSAASKDEAAEIQTEIKFTASYGQLLNFLHEVTLSKNLILVHNLKATPFVDLSGSDQTLSVQMTLGGLQRNK